jgi:plasmid maintenance system antidote protein VapI
VTETRRLLELVGAQIGRRSNRQIARALGVTTQSVGLLMSGQRTMGTETAMKVAELLDLDLATVLKTLQAERERRSPKSAQQSLMF